MNYRNRLLLAVAAIVLVSIPALALARDTSYEGRKIVTVPAGTVVEGDFFAAGDRVEISGEVTGDLYAAGAEVVIDGTVAGDVLAAGGIVRISGTVGDDLRAAGGQINVGGRIDGSATLTGGNVDLVEGSEVKGNIVVAGGSIIIASAVAGDVTSAGGNITISGTVGGKVVSYVDILRLTSRASIGKTLTYTSPRPASLDPNAKIAGTVKFTEVAKKRISSKEMMGVAIGASLIIKTIAFIAFAIVGVLIVRLFPIFAEKARAELAERPWASLGTGIIIMIVVPVMALLLIITLIGLPLGLIAMAGYSVLMYLGKFVPIFVIGRIALKNRSAVAAVIAGAFMYYVILLVPFIGAVVTGIASIAGAGAWVNTKKRMYNELKVQGKI